ncbi:MAG: efflux RND transporter periplasmic adaptor subunit [bacterium]
MQRAKLWPPESPGSFSTGLLLVLTGLLLGMGSGCSEGKSESPKAPPPVPVAVAQAVRRNVPIEVNAIGNVEAYNTVSIKSRTGGELLKVHFQEGQEVSKGDLLFTIDPRPYEAALAEAKARLAKDLALLKKAQQDAERYASLLQKQVVSQEQYDQVRANLAALEATVKAEEAAVESAKLQLSYCYIYAPISGRTGSLLAHVGNLIKASDENKSMVVIRQIQPIYVSFSVPEQYLPRIKARWAAGKLPVRVSLRNGEGRFMEGELTFMENTVDPATGTILLKATFPNQDRALWPGQFVDVALKLEEQPNALLIPSHAVQTGQQGTYVFLVGPGNTAQMRPVRVGRSLGQETVVEQGLQEGDLVITDGQIRLVPGTKVELKGAEDSARQNP